MPRFLGQLHSNPAGAAADNVNFAAGAAGVLKFDQCSAVTGSVSGFGAGDTLDLTDSGGQALSDRRQAQR